MKTCFVAWRNSSFALFSQDFVLERPGQRQVLKLYWILLWFLQLSYLPSELHDANTRILWAWLHCRCLVAAAFHLLKQALVARLDARAGFAAAAAAGEVIA